MRGKKGISVFVFFLMIGVILLSAFTLISFVPAYQCPVGSPHDPILWKGEHVITYWDGRVRYWT